MNTFQDDNGQILMVIEVDDDGQCCRMTRAMLVAMDVR